MIPRATTPGDVFGPPAAEPVAQAVAFIQYAKPKATVNHTINRVRLFLAFGVLGGTLLAFFAGLYVAERAMRPIAGLTRAAREVARTRDPDITLPKPRANDEVSDLANTFEAMLRELGAAREETEATLDRQRDFVADASHELRTPLTSILANLELLESELSGEQREMAESALRSSKRMRRLVGDLLLLARADAGREAPQAPLDLAAVAREAAQEAAVLASDHPLSLDVQGPGHDHGGRRRPAPAGRQPGRERADPHRSRHAGHGLGHGARATRPCWRSQTAAPACPRRCASACSSASPAAAETPREPAAAGSAWRS